MTLREIKKYNNIPFHLYDPTDYRPPGKFVDHAPYCVNNAAARGEAAATYRKTIHKLSSTSVHIKGLAAMYLVSLDPASPYPKFVKTRSAAVYRGEKGGE